MIDIHAIREKYREEMPLYDELVVYVKKILAEETRRKGVICKIEGRAKEMTSLLKKALGKKQTYNRIRDKAGVRIVATYYDSLPTLEEIVRQRFNVVRCENKKLGLSYNELGYLGIHLDVKLKESDLSGVSRWFRGRLCEIQLHTHGQNLWANISHELLYKGALPLPDDTQRSIYQLVALVELFDDQVKRARHYLMAQPGYEEAKMLSLLEKHFYRLSTRPFDGINRELSIRLITLLEQLYTAEERAGFGILMDQFVASNENILEEIFEDFAADERDNLLLSQPESLMIFERLEHAQHHLEKVWSAEFPLSLLSPLASMWGKPILDDSEL